MLSAIIRWLHTNEPSPVLTTIGPVTLYWYGFFYAVAIALGYWLVHKTLQRFMQTRDQGLRAQTLQLTASLPDLTLALIVFGLIGARLYHVANEPSYYLAHPLQILALWRGGLAIHGALIADVIFLWYYARRYGYSLLWLLDLLAPAMLLGQAIGRWGNYMNQELFGRPTSLPWGIPIDLTRRPPGFETFTYFHPTFLYESLWDLVGFFIIFMWYLRRSRGGKPNGFIFFSYLFWVSLGRLWVELLRVDKVPLLLGWRLPFLMSCVLMLVSIVNLWVSLTRYPQKAYTV